MDASVKRHRLKDRKSDVYFTPPEAVTALCRAEWLPLYVWEPACGSGNIVNVLRARGHQVLASDLNDYGDPTHFYGRDFLMEHKAPDRCGAIVTNPPFMLAQKFVEHGLKLCPLVIMLLRLSFLESERRCDILDNGQLARVHVFRNRLPMMHRKGWAGPKSSNTVAFAWFVWERNHNGPATLRRISWERGDEKVEPSLRPIAVSGTDC